MSRAIINARPMIIPHPTWRTARQRPSFHLDFKQGTVDLRAGNLGTFTRNSVKNVWNGSQYVSVAANVPALQRDPATGLWGYLHEPAATNLVLRSTVGPSGNSFTRSNLTTPMKSGVPNPLGLSEVCEVILNAGTGMSPRLTNAVSVVAGTRYSASVILKANGTSTCGVFWNSASYDPNFPNANVWIDLITGVVSGNQSANTPINVRHLGDGWWLIRTSALADVTGSTQGIAIVPGSTGNANNISSDGTDSLYVCHVQLETGPAATSPIITTGSAVTRPADVWNWTGGQFSSWYNQAGGTIVSDALQGVVVVSQFPRYWQLDAGNEQNRISGVSYANSSLRFAVINGNINQGSFDLGALSPIGTRLRGAWAFSNAGFAASRDGGSPTTPLTGGTLPTVTQFTLGNAANQSTNNNANTLIREIAYFPPGSAQDRLQALSAL